MPTRPLALAAALALPVALGARRLLRRPTPAASAARRRRWPDRGQGHRHRVRGLAHRGPGRHGRVHGHELRHQGQRVLRLRRGRPDHRRGRERRARPDPHLPRRARPSPAPTRPPASRGWWATASAPPFTVTGRVGRAEERRREPRRRRSPSTSATSPRSPTRSSPRRPSSSRSSRPARSTRPRRSTRPPGPTGSASSRSRSPSATSTRRSTGARRSSTRAWSSPATTASRRTCGRTACSPTPRAIADQLLADVTELVDQGQGRRAQPAPARQRLQGAARRDRHRQDHRRGGALQPHRPLGLRGQLRGVQGGHRRRCAPSSQAQRPGRSSRRIDERGKALGDLLETHRDGDGFVLYPELTPADVKALTEALDAFVRAGRRRSPGWCAQG